MGKFFVGQRVKVVADFNPGHGGAEPGYQGVITGGFDFWPVYSLPGVEEEEGMYGYEVDSDYVCDESELEPILPDGHRASDYSFSELMDKCRGVMA